VEPLLALFVVLPVGIGSILLSMVIHSKIFGHEGQTTYKCGFVCHAVRVVLTLAALAFLVSFASMVLGGMKNILIRKRARNTGLLTTVLSYPLTMHLPLRLIVTPEYRSPMLHVAWSHQRQTHSASIA